MTKKKIGFHWDSTVQKAFDDLKKEFRDEDILANFDPELSELVEADAFDRDVEGVYSQKQKDEK